MTPGPIDTPILYGYIVKLNDPAAMREAACPGLGVTLISLFQGTVRSRARGSDSAASGLVR